MAVVKKRINGQISEKISKSHFALNSCVMKFSALKTTPNNVKKPIMSPVTLERFVEITSKLFCKKVTIFLHVEVKKSSTAFKNFIRVSLSKFFIKNKLIN